MYTVKFDELGTQQEQIFPNAPIYVIYHPIRVFREGHVRSHPSGGMIRTDV